MALVAAIVAPAAAIELAWGICLGVAWALGQVM